MGSFLLIIIYIAFISLGLPDSLIGSAWPIMHSELAVPLSYAGIITMIIAGCTILSSLSSNYLTNKLGTGLITALSVLTTAMALYGFSISNTFIELCLWAVPYGLGAGAVDAALNNYAALYFSSKHMNWLHCFWGLGASLSPYIMGFYLTNNLNWSGGYRAVFLIQVALVIVLFLSLPLWKTEVSDSTVKKSREDSYLSLKDTLKIKGLKYMLITFICYCALEQTVALWSTTYLVAAKGISPIIGAKFTSLFFLGITAGRFISGLFSDKLGDKKLIQMGSLLTIVGILFMLFANTVEFMTLAGLLIIGLGCAPIYPSIIHATPDNFGKGNSQAVIGVQMASAYIGSTFMPPLFGLFSEILTIRILPIYLLFFALLMLFSFKKVNQIVKEKIIEEELADQVKL
ncbi:MAG: MFS transporter [Carnobacterium sp.]|uniref:MFS transporter n=1 Tax=Carnobacterium sp. TaxID=48221 RepID=UPI0033156FE9